LAQRHFHTISVKPSRNPGQSGAQAAPESSEITLPAAFKSICNALPA
jgi:hypothetical protein